MCKEPVAKGVADRNGSGAFAAVLSSARLIACRTPALGEGLRYGRGGCVDGGCCIKDQPLIKPAPPRSYGETGAGLKGHRRRNPG